MPDPSFSLKLGGNNYIGWTEMSLSRSMDRMSGAFRLGLTGKPDAEYIASQILPGAEAEIEIDGQSVLIGYIDTLETSYDKGRSGITVAGRDRVGDLIDCAATVDGPFEYNGQRLDQILGEILRPYGIPVSFQADAGAAFGRIAIQPGETAFELIERMCRYRSLLPISDGLGGLLIIKPGQEKSSGALVYGENILEGSINIDNSNRFSLVVVKGQEEGSLDNSAEDVAGAEGRASDSLITRYRPKVITAEQPDSLLSLSDRAAWEIAMARARSLNATYKVQSWYADGQSDLWKINTLVSVKDTPRRLSRDMLIKSVTFERANAGTITSLDLALPDAFNLPAESNPDEDDLGGI